MNVNNVPPGDYIGIHIESSYYEEPSPEDVQAIEDAVKETPNVRESYRTNLKMNRRANVVTTTFVVKGRLPPDSFDFMETYLDDIEALTRSQIWIFPAGF